MNLQEFLKCPKKRGLMSKYFANPTKFANTRTLYLPFFEAFEKLEHYKDIPISEQLLCVSLGLRTPPTCPVCSTKIKPDFNRGVYPNYCSKQCSSVNNNPHSKKVIIDGVIYNSISAACIKLNTTYFLIKLKLYSENYPTHLYYPNHEYQMKKEKEELAKIHPLLINYNFLESKKSNYETMHDVCVELGVKLDTLRLAYTMCNIDTQYEQISREAKQLLTDKAWLELQIETKTSNQIAEELCCSPSAVQQHVNYHGLKLKNLAYSMAEKEISYFINSLGFDVIERDRDLIAPLELDIYIPSMKIAIEYNGVYFHREKPKYHYIKYEMCHNKGIKLIQIFEDDWMLKSELIKKKLMHILGIEQEKIYARKCIAKTINGTTAKRFYLKHHIYGHKNCNEHYGLFHGDDLVAAMSFIKNKLERFATSCSVVGGFTKLLHYSGKTNITTFADLCWSTHNDNVYTKNGFKFETITQPNYWWIIKGKRVNRISTQKHKLKNYPTYDSIKSEAQILHEMGYYRIYDAGHARLSLTT